jgi:hypothetical protein
MEIEYDENKSKINKQKHGLDFEEAKKLFEDNNALVIPAKIVENEKRFALISKCLGKCFVAIFTFRGEKIRLISVRRCRKNEEVNYENNC